MRHRRPRGHVLALMILALVAVSALVMAAADGRLGRARAADRLWQGIAAEALAHSGLEASVAALRQGGPVPSRPLEAARVTHGPGRVEVTELSAAPRRILSCGQVGPARRCLEGTLASKPRWRIVRAVLVTE